MRILSRIQGFFSSWRFPALALSALGAFELLLVVMLLVPSSADALGAFAEEFRTWCFGWDPATGKMEWAYVAMMMAHPVVIGGLVAAVWWRPLREARARSLLPYFGSAALLVVGATSSLVLLSNDAEASELPFPAEELRTELPAPVFELSNQEGDRVRLADLRGEVVVLTGVYATCGHTCPLIMQQLERAIGALEPAAQKQVRAVLVTLNPEHDDQQVLRDLAARHEVSAPQYQFLTGPVPEVNRALDELQIARKKDPHSGVIDHANLFIVLDRTGRIAYRFTLGERQERWLAQALRILVRESAPAGGA